jgi:hypothetical protein
MGVNFSTKPVKGVGLLIFHGNHSRVSHGRHKLEKASRLNKTDFHRGLFFFLNVVIGILKIVRLGAFICFLVF